MSILAEGKTPEEWVAVLAERSIPVSARTLREADEGSIRERIRTPRVQTEVEDQRKEA